MKIMLISGEYPPRIGGVADYTCHLAQALARLGHHVSVLTTANGRSDGWAMEAGDHVEVYPDVRDWGVRGAASISARVRDLTPDVIDFQYVPHMYGRGGFAPGAAILPLRLRRLSSATIVSTVHEIASPWSLKPRRAFAAAAHRVQALLLAIASDHCIVTNQRYARQMRKWTRSGSALHEIPVGAGIEPVPLSEPERESLRSALARKDGQAMGDLSALSVDKRPEDLIAVLSSLDRRAQLTLLGGLAVDQRRRQWFMDRAASAGLAERVRWADALSSADLSRDLYALDVYIHTHSAGASTRSTTLASALAHGLPVVAYRGAETSPLFVDGENILLAPQGDVLALIEGVQRLLDSPDLRARLSRGARDLYLRCLTWDSIARQFLGAVS